MKVDGVLRTRDLAEAGQVGVQQVRNYEASGLIPAAERGPSGYRRYTQRHLAALATARILVAGYGWQRARAIMQGVHRGDLPAALAPIDDHHAELAGQRQRAEQTLAALRALVAPPAVPVPTRPGHQLRVGAAARQVGVRVSALRFWEGQGLLHPLRDERSGYRLYDAQQMRRLRIVALLREQGYDFGAIRATLDQLAAGTPEHAIAAVERRRAAVARAGWACLVATAALHGYIGTHWPDLVAQP